MALPDEVRISHAAVFLNVSEFTIRSMIRAGKLPKLQKKSFHYRVWPRAEIEPILTSLRECRE